MKTVFDQTMEQYEEAILQSMKPDYEWYTLKMLRETDKITIGRIQRLVEERKNQDPDDIFAAAVLNTPEDVVRDISHTIKQNIEWSPSGYLKQTGYYRVPFHPQELGGGWRLEDYHFEKYEGDVFFSSVTAGDRSIGASRNFYIPKRYFLGHTYEEFLTEYFDEIASSSAFGLSKEELIDNEELKAFLGFD